MEVISYVGLVALLVLVAASVWFNIFLLRRLIRINENLDNTLDFLNDYLSHIKDVYKLERFYGDEILSELMEHIHEQAIIKYANTECLQERTKLYINYIQPAFSEMVDKITYTYKFTSLPNVDCLRDECKIWLTTILDKYDPNKGSKAFSYFSVITKNWFIHKVKKTTQKSKREITLDDISAVKMLENRALTTSHKYIQTREEKEFWDFLLSKISDWEKEEETNSKNAFSNDLKVIRAIKELLGEPDNVEILNKKAIYLYMRELTGLNTKQIATSLKKLKVKYYLFKKEWNGGKI